MIHNKSGTHAVSKAGFTLIEVLLAVGILAVGMSAVLGLFTFGAALSHAAILRTESADVVEAITIDLPSKLFPLDENGMPSLPVDLRDQEIPGHGALQYHAIATPVEGGPTAEDGGPLEFDVQVEIFFSRQGVRRARTFHTRLLREQSFAERIRRSAAKQP